MVTTIRTTKKILTAYYLITLHVAVVYFAADKIAERYSIVSDPQSNEHEPRLPDSAPANVPLPSPTSTATAEQTPVVAIPPIAGLIIPVAGITKEQLRDSFADSRSEGRVHDAIDIIAPAGTPVIAATDGKIVKFFESEAGGTTIYQLSTDKKYVFYYAHLQNRANDLNVGDEVKQGRTIALVGDTGNAGAGNYHLHFSIMAVTDPERYWEGVYVNPYPLLTQ